MILHDSAVYCSLLYILPTYSSSLDGKWKATFSLTFQAAEAAEAAVAVPVAAVLAAAAAGACPLCQGCRPCQPTCPVNLAADGGE